jgi:nicotinate-nucleotide adenylyltransferase
MKKVNSGIGLFGGTFDPLHIGHLIVAEWLAEVLEIEKTYFIPTKIHPLKNRAGISDEHTRLEMLSIALENYTNFEISTFELDRESVSYSIDTIKYFKNKYPQNEIYYFVGRDNLDNFLQWKEPFEILDLCYLVVYDRKTGKDVNDLMGHQKILTVESPIIEISSSHIRKRIGKQMTFRSLVPQQVFEYITRNKLYQK